MALSELLFLFIQLWAPYLFFFFFLFFFLALSSRFSSLFLSSLLSFYSFIYIHQSPTDTFKSLMHFAETSDHCDVLLVQGPFFFTYLFLSFICFIIYYSHFASFYQIIFTISKKQMEERVNYLQNSDLKRHLAHNFIFICLILFTILSTPIK